MICRATSPRQLSVVPGGTVGFGGSGESGELGGSRGPGGLAVLAGWADLAGLADPARLADTRNGLEVYLSGGPQCGYSVARQASVLVACATPCASGIAGGHHGELWRKAS